MVEPLPRRPTSADVARVAGVSRATVSYVLNDTPHQKIPDATRQRVLAAATGLGYAPSAAARTLRSGRSDVVLCLLPDWPLGQEVGLMLTSLSTALARRGLTVVVHPAARDDRPVSEIWKAITPAAVLAFEDFTAEEVTALRAAGVALLGRSVEPRRDLMVPQEHTGRVQVDHLTGAGRVRLGYAFPDDRRLLTFAEPRLNGVRAGCAALGLEPPVVQTVPLEADDAAVAVQLWREAGVTGVCAYNDEVALAVLAGLRVLGLTAPGDLAVIGVDDIPVARLSHPPLTTVATDQTVVAGHLADTIVAAIAGRAEPAWPDGGGPRVVHRGSA